MLLLDLPVDRSQSFAAIIPFFRLERFAEVGGRAVVVAKQSRPSLS